MLCVIILPVCVSKAHTKSGGKTNTIGSSKIYPFIISHHTRKTLYYFIAYLKVYIYTWYTSSSRGGDA